MKLPQLILVTAVMLAAGILFPIRRAQMAFALHSQASVIAIPRIKLRRRPGGPRTVIKSQLRSDRVDDPARRTTAGSDSATAAEEDAATFESSGNRHPTASDDKSVGTQGHVTAGASVDGEFDWAIDGRENLPRLPLLATALPPAPQSCVIPQTARDVPVPPPKHATL
jgi:hypothetical protein